VADRVSKASTKEDKLAAAQALVEAGDLKAAERALYDLIARGGAPFEARALRTRVLLRLERGGDALEVARRALEHHPQWLWAHALMGETLIKLDVPAEAETVATRALEIFPDAPVLHAQLAQARRLGGDLEGALAAIENAIARAPDNIEFKLRRAVLLAALGRIEEADEIRSGIEDSATQLLAIYRDWIYAFQRLGLSALAMRLCENAGQLMPSRGRPWLWRAELLLADDKVEPALIALDRSTRSNEPMGEDESFRHARLKARAHRLKDDREAARAAFEEAERLRPDDQTNLRDLYVLHLQAGRDDDMRDYGRRISQAGAKKLPPTLAGGLAEFKGRRPPPSLMTGERARWAWELADKTKWTQTDWLKALYWGQNADKLMRDWWLSAFERADEIAALIDRPQDTVIDALPEGARCVTVTTHMGPLAAGVVYMQTCGRPWRGFGFAGPDPVVEGEPPMRISAKGNTSLRELFREIEKGTLMGFAAESPDADQLRLDFLGRRITLATTVPRLIWKLKTHSVWWHALWKDGRIVMELERLPDPEDGEALEPWCRRWTDAYLERVAKVMRGTPENLNLGHGIWRNVEEE